MNIYVSFDGNFAFFIAERAHIHAVEVGLWCDFDTLTIEYDLVLALIRAIWSNLAKGVFAQWWQGFTIFLINFFNNLIIVVLFLLEEVLFFLVFFRLFVKFVCSIIIYLSDFLLHFSCLSLVS